MSPPNRGSLRRKLLFPILSFVTCVFLISQAFSYYTTFQREKGNLIERVKVLANGVAYNLEAAILFDDSLAADEVLSAFSADEEVIRVKLYTAEGQLFAIYQREDLTGSIPTPTKTEQQLILENQFAVAQEHIYLYVPIVIENEVIAGLRVTISKRYFAQLLESVIKSSLFFLLIMMTAGYVLYLMIQKVVIQPVFGLNEAMRLFIDRKQSQMESIDAGNDEIGELVRCFNTMMERLTQREKQVHFTLDRLEQEKAFATEVIETVQHALVVVDDAGRIILTNGTTNEVFRCTSAFLKGMRLYEVLHVREQGLFEQALNSTIQLDDQLFTSKDVFNQEQVLQISSRKLSKPGMVLFAIQDVTEVEQSIRRQRLAAGVFENSQDGLLVLNQHGIITMVNPAMSHMLGFRSDEMVNYKAENVLDWTQFSALIPTINEAVDNFGQWQGEISEIHKNGTQVPLFVKVSKINADLENASFDMVLIISDLSDVKEMERLEYLAHHDSLTGLANRANLHRVLETTISEHQSRKGEYAVIYLDLDGFKLVNDTFGHDAGDEVLRRVSERLKSQVRTTDLVARLSGDEFVVLLNPTDRPSAEHMAERLRHVLTEDIHYNNQVLNVGASVGVYLGSGKDSSVASVLNRADRAMYQAKVQGKGCFVMFDNSLEEKNTVNSSIG